MTRITGARTLDIRAPTSITLAGSDAVHQDPDYSGAYVFLAHRRSARGRRHDVHDRARQRPVLRGDRAARAAGRRAATSRSSLPTAPASGGASPTTASSAGSGPEKGVIHLATAALVNAVWDLWARVEGKPLWQLVCDLTPEQFVASVDFRYLTDVLDPDEALDLLRALAPTRADARRRARTRRLSRVPHVGGLARLQTRRRCATCAGRRSPTAGAASRPRSGSTSPATSAAAR